MLGDVLEFIGDDVLEFIGDDVLEFIGDDVLEFIGDDSSLRAAAGWLSAASLSPLSSRTRRHSGVAAATDARSVDAGRRQGQGCSVASVTQSATTFLIKLENGFDTVERLRCIEASTPLRAIARAENSVGVVHPSRAESR